MIAAERRPGNSASDWVREFVSVWHWGDVSIRIWIVGAIVGIGYPGRILFEAAVGNEVARSTLAGSVAASGCAIGAAMLVISNRLAKRREAREAIATEAFAEVKEELNLRPADHRGFLSLLHEARKSVNYSPSSSERIIDAFALTYGGRDLLLYDLEQRYGSVDFRVLAATRVDASYPRSSLTIARLKLLKRSGYPGVVLRGAAKAAPDELRRWVSEQVPGTSFYTDGTWALCDFDSYLTGENIGHIVRSLAKFADLLDSGSMLTPDLEPRPRDVAADLPPQSRRRSRGTNDLS